jgi:hypothetical protein
MNDSDSNNFVFPEPASWDPNDHHANLVWCRCVVVPMSQNEKIAAMISRMDSVLIKYYQDHPAKKTIIFKHHKN